MSLRSASIVMPEDTTGRHFKKTGDGQLEEPNVAFPAAVAAAEAVIDHVDELSNLVGRKVENWNGFPGKVDKFFVRNQEFQVRYYDAENPGKRAKKLMKVTHQELLDLLIEDDDGVFDDEVIWT